MKPKEFVEGIRESVIDSNLQIYKNLFQNTELGQAKDPYWIKALSFFKTLNNEQREIFFSILRQLEVDTVSNILGILDGTSFFNKQIEDFELTTSANIEKINGELQDIFLELENK